MAKMRPRLAGLCLAACLAGTWVGAPAAAAELDSSLTAAAATALVMGPAAGEYSDPAVLQARLLAGGVPVAGQPVAFSVGGVAVGEATTGAGGVAALSWTADLPAGAHPVTAQFAGGAGLAASRADATFTVLPETAFLIYDGLLLVTGGPVQIRARVAPEEDGTPGQPARAGQVRVTVTPAGGGAAAARLALPVGPDGWAEAVLTLPEASYDVTLGLEPGGDYSARPLAVRLPSRADSGRSLMARLTALYDDVAAAETQTAAAFGIHLDVAQRRLQSAIDGMDLGDWEQAGRDLDAAAQQVEAFMAFAAQQGIRQGVGDRSGGWQFAAYGIAMDMRWLRGYLS